MNPRQYQAFTDALQHNLERDPRVIGLMAAGSMANGSHQPDEWSDHDFWVVVESGAEAWFINQQEWLPDHDQIVLYFREPVHGAIKAIYSTAHLLEFAVSDRQGLLGVSVNDYHLLIDKATLAADLKQMLTSTESAHQEWIRDDLSLMGEFIANILVGICRYQRGELLSSRQFIKVSSLQPLLRLIPKHIPSERSDVLDSLDPLRRFEVAYPEIGAELNRLLQLEPGHAASRLIDLADNLLRSKITNYPTEAVAAVRRRILI
jgi:hypothetical protein